MFEKSKNLKIKVLKNHKIKKKPKKKSQNFAFTLIK